MIFFLRSSAGNSLLLIKCLLGKLDEYDSDKEKERFDIDYSSNRGRNSLFPPLLLFLVVDSDFLIEEVDTFLVSEDSIPPGIESDFDSEGDIIFP
ncbi:hypothetical protein Tco_0008561 [Tanacetum coccineum]